MKRNKAEIILFGKKKPKHFENIILLLHKSLLCPDLRQSRQFCSLYPKDIDELREGKEREH